jgi:hypothetical protein
MTPIPDDPGEFIAAHPYLDVSRRTVIDISGYEGIQFDVTVTGTPLETNTLRFGGYQDHAAFMGLWEVGESLRLAFVSVDGQPLFMFTRAGVLVGGLLEPTGGGPAATAVYHDELLERIEFTSP